MKLLIANVLLVVVLLHATDAITSLTCVLAIDALYVGLKYE